MLRWGDQQHVEPTRIPLDAVLGCGFCYTEDEIRDIFRRHGSEEDGVPVTAARAIRTEIGECNFMDLILGLFVNYAPYEHWLERHCESISPARRNDTDLVRHARNYLIHGETLKEKHIGAYNLCVYDCRQNVIVTLNEGFCVTLERYGLGPGRRPHATLGL